MEEKILILEDKVNQLKIDFENYIKSETEKTNAITSLINGYLEFLKKYEIEHDAVIKKFEEIDSVIELIIKLRKGDETIQKLKDSIDKIT
ncbi:MAG: hypothetical protein ACK4M1_05065 [Flavobacterium sp.]